MKWRNQVAILLTFAMVLTVPSFPTLAREMKYNNEEVTEAKENNEMAELDTDEASVEENQENPGQEEKTELSKKEEILLSGLHTIDGYTYFYDENHERVTGWKKIDGAWYYFDGNDEIHHGAMVKNVQKIIGKATYFFDENGKMKTGWIKSAEGYYYGDDYCSTGWKEWNGKWYYMDFENTEYPGIMLENTRKSIDGNTYFFDGSGAMQTDWIWTIDGWYFADDSGKQKLDWMKWRGNWYYLDRSDSKHPGIMLKNTVRVIGNSTYAFHPGGSMATGWFHYGGNWYYSDMSSSTGWKECDGDWYYLDGDDEESPGRMLKDTWKYINGNYYYFRSDGTMKRGWLWDNGKWYYLNGSGSMVTGWKKVDGTWYYLYSDGSMAHDTTIDGWILGPSGAWCPYDYDDFVLVDISSQTLTYYKNHELKLSTPVVTGQNGATPRGTYWIRNRVTNTYLVGPGYRAFVYYWMPFIGNMYGLHDSTWRTGGYGGNIYTYNGSHGCVNMPLDKVEELFYMVTTYKTRVIIE